MKKKIRSFFDISMVLTVMLVIVMLGAVTITKSTLSEEIIEILDVGTNPDAEFEWMPVDASGSYTIDGHEITLHETDQFVTLEIHISSWDPHLLMAVQATIDSAGYSNGVGGMLSPLGWPGTPTDGAFINTVHPDYVGSGLIAIDAVSTSTLDYIWGVAFIGSGKVDDGQSYYLGTLVLDVPANANGTYTIGFLDGTSSTFMRNSIGNKIEPLILTSALITIAPPNQPPNNPASSYDKKNDELVVTATDPDEDQVRYGVDWNDDLTIDQWTSLVPSGSEQRIDCGGRKGTVGVIAEDEHGAQSDWDSVKYKTKTINTPFLTFLENHPHLFPLIRQILGL